MKGVEVRGGEDRSGGTIIPLIQQRERSTASCIVLSSEQGRLRSPLALCIQLEYLFFDHEFFPNIMINKTNDKYKQIKKARNKW